MIWQNFYRKLKIRNSRHIYFYSLALGIFSGLLTIAFSSLLSSIEYLSLNQLGGLDFHHPPGENSPLNFAKDAKMLQNWTSPWVLFFLPILGGLLVGIILQFFYRDSSGAGTDSIIYAYHYKEGKIKTRGSFFKALTTIFTLSSGGSGGREGPTAYIGASLGVGLAKYLKAGARARRTLLIAGIAGGLGAIFRAPLGGAMTAVEILYREDIESDALVPALIASVTSYLTYTGIMGPGSLFRVSDIGLKHHYELLVYAILGLVCYGVGFLYVKSLRCVENLTQKLNIPILWKPAIGGFFVGLVALFYPEVIASGMGFVHETINGRSSIYENSQTSSSSLSLAIFFFILVVLKILATSFTIGTGGSGGLFAPSLFIGAMLGGGVSYLSQYFFPNFPLHVPSFMLVGMGAFFSGVAHTPFSAIIMISDIVGSYALLPPLMMVSMITFILSSRWSLYKGQIHNRFRSPAHIWNMRLDDLEEKKLKADDTIKKEKPKSL